MEGLGINLPTLLAQIINFAILFGLLYLVAYKPILRMFDQRSAKIKESMEQTEQIKQDAARSEEETKAQLEIARKEGQNIIAQATQIGGRLKEEAKEEARREAETLINKARVEIQRESDAAIDELKKDFANIAIMAAEKVINETLDEKKHRQLIEEVLKESTTFKN